MRSLDDPGVVPAALCHLPDGHPVDRVHQVGGDFPQGDQDEFPPFHVGMRHVQAPGGIHQTVIDQDVDVDLPRSPAFGRCPADLLLDPFDLAEQAGRIEGVSISTAALRKFPCAVFPYGSVS